MGDPGGTADVIGRAGELQAVDRFLERASHGLASLLIDGEAGIGKTALWRASLARAGSRGARILRSAPAESERTLTLGGLTDVLAEVGPDRPRAAARGPTTRPGDRAPARGAVRPAAGPAHAVGGDRKPAPEPCQRVDPRPCHRRCPVARRRVGLDPCLCDPAPDRPAGRCAPRRARRADRANARADRRRPTRAAGAAPRRADAAGGAPSAVPGPVRPIVPPAGARADRGARRAAIRSMRSRSPARSRTRRRPRRRASRSGSPRPSARSSRGGSPPSPTATQAALLLAAVAIEPTLETLRRADPESPGSLAAGGRGRDRGAGPRIDPVRTSAAGAGRHRDGEPGGAATASTPSLPGRRPPTMREPAISAAPRRVATRSSQPRSRQPRPTPASRGATLDAASLYEQASQLTPGELPDEVIRRAMLWRGVPVHRRIGDRRGRRDPRAGDRRGASRTCASPRPEPASGRPLLPRPDPGRGPAR